MILTIQSSQYTQSHKEHQMTLCIDLYKKIGAMIFDSGFKYSEVGPLAVSPHMKHDQQLPEDISKWSFGINAAIEPRSEWQNGIFHNASYVIITIMSDRCELLSKHNNPKMRSFKFKSEDQLIEKLTKYFSEAANSHK